MDTSTNITPSCVTCHKTQTDLPQPLKRCTKCQTTQYCSRECQKEDWKQHKRVCGSAASSHQDTASSSGQHNPGFHAVNQFLGLADDTYWHKLPEKEAMVQLIDCFRMRMEDEYMYAGNPRGRYAGEDPLPVFREFLDLAEKQKGLLPSWWNEDKRRECERVATGGDGWANINFVVEKSDIMEHYHNTMPMTLRVLGEKIYGRGFM